MQIDYGITAIYVASVVTMIALPGPVMLLVTGARLAGGPGESQGSCPMDHAATCPLSRGLMAA